MLSRPWVGLDHRRRGRRHGKKRGKVGAAAPQLSVLASFSFDYSFVLFLLIIPTYDLVLHFFVSSHSYTLDFFPLCYIFFFPFLCSFLLDLFDSSTFLGDMEVAMFRGGHME